MIRKTYRQEYPERMHHHEIGGKVENMGNKEHTQEDRKRIRNDKTINDIKKAGVKNSGSLNY